MEATSLLQYAAGMGIQAFFVVFVWRMARRLYPLIDSIKEMNAGPAYKTDDTSERLPQNSQG